MASVTVKIEGLKGLKAKLNKRTAEIKSMVGMELQESANTMANGAVADAPVDQGLLKAQISVKKVDQLNYEVVSPNFYSPYLEFGTKTYVQVPAGLEEVASKFRGKSPHGGSVDELFLAIIDWVKRKGLSGRYSVKTKRRQGSKNEQLSEDYDIAFPIVRAILKKGIKPQPFFFKQLAGEKEALLKRVKEILGD